MEKEVTFNGRTVKVFWNGKTYANGKRFVKTVGGQVATGTYEDGFWTKKLGNDAFNDAIARAFGWKIN